jgi:cell division protein FtsW (lipid II flippase)
MVLLIVIQAFAHIGVNTGVFPVTGQTLPMISMGGTSMLITGIQLGMLLSVSRELMEEAKAPVVGTEPANETFDGVKDEGNSTDTIID